jgi:hypothetical protein
MSRLAAYPMRRGHSTRAAFSSFFELCHNRRAMRKLACLSMVVLASACSSNSECALPPVDAAPQPDAALPGSDLAAPDLRPAQTCDHAIALCAKLAECAPFLLAAAYGDLAGCNDRLTKVCTAQSQSEGSGMTLANILACETALATAICDDVFANNVPGCAFRGTFPDGATCGDSSQCQSGFCGLGGNLCGVCTAKGAAGVACPSGSNDECATGLVCSSGKICVAPAVLGAVCDDATAPCLVGSFCTTGKTCALTVKAGAECPGAYLNLGDGTLCFGKSSATSPQYAAQIGTAGPGELCGLAPADDLPATLCAPGSVAACTLLSGGIALFNLPTEGMCAALTKDGYRCTTSSACLTGAQCIAGTCQIPSGRYCSALDAGS